MQAIKKLQQHKIFGEDSVIESYIEKYVGMDMDGTFRDKLDMGTMYFNRTLEDWARFNINNRTKFDAAISSGLAIMACNKNKYKPVADFKRQVVPLGFKKYSNSGYTSKIIE